MAIITAAGLSDLYNQRAFNKNGSTVTLKKISETEWLLFGDLAEGDSEGFVSEPSFLMGGAMLVSSNNPSSTYLISLEEPETYTTRGVMQSSEEVLLNSKDYFVSVSAIGSYSDPKVMVRRMDSQFNTISEEYVGTISSSAGNTTYLKGSGDGNRLLASISNGRLILLDTSNDTSFSEIALPPEFSGYANDAPATMSGDGRYVAAMTRALSDSYNLYVYDIESQAIIYTEGITYSTYAANTNLSFSSDGRYLSYIESPSIRQSRGVIVDLELGAKLASAGTFSNIRTSPSNFSTLVPHIHAEFNPNKMQLAVSLRVSPFLIVYDIEDNWNELPINPISLPVDRFNNISCNFYPDGSKAVLSGSIPLDIVSTADWRISQEKPEVLDTIQSPVVKSISQQPT